MAGGHQRPRRDRRNTNTAGNRCAYLGIGKIDFGGFQRRLILRDGGYGLQIGCHRIIRILFGDAILLHQCGIALRLQAAGLHRSLGTFQLRGGLIVTGLVGRGIDLIQHLSGFDLRPFGKQACLDNAFHLRTNIRGHGGIDPARQVTAQRDRLAAQRCHANLRRTTGSGRHTAALTITGRQPQRQADQ
ncbi:hypothetical protein D3C78_1404650 [compost metagenome]